MPIQVGAFEIDERNYELRKHGSRVPVPPRVFDTIVFLATNANRVVTKAELIHGPWRGASVTDAAVFKIIRHARMVLGDNLANPELIVTVRGRGFRLEGAARHAASGPAGGASPHALAAKAGPHFCGRVKQLAALEDAWAAASTGHGGLVLITGEPGIGKTTLAEQFAARLMPGVSVHWGRAWEAGGAPSFWPWFEALRSFRRTRQHAELRTLLRGIGQDIVRVVPMLREDLPAEDFYEDLDETAEARFRVFDSVASFLHRAASREPLLLILEDLHAADEATLSLLAFIARSLGQARILLVGTCRSPDLEERSQLKTLIDRAPPISHVHIEGLAEHELLPWLAQAPCENLQNVASRVHRLTAGHPILVQCSRAA